MENAFETYVTEVLGEWNREFAKSSFEDAFEGEWDCLEDYALSLLEELYPLPPTPYAGYDVDQMVHDLKMDGYIFANGFVFRPV